MNSIRWIPRSYAPTWLDGFFGDVVVFTIFISTQQDHFTVRNYLPWKDGKRHEDIVFATIEDAKRSAETGIETWLKATGILK